MIRKDLENELQKCGSLKFDDCKLVSGNDSKYYVDIKKAITNPKILCLISKYVTQIISENNVEADYIACVELGGVPIGTAISIATGLPLIVIRKEKKDYGIKNRIIGDIEKGKIVLIVDDVTTTGGSVLRAAQLLRSEGMIIQSVISVVDRDEGAKEALNKEELLLLYCLRVSSSDKGVKLS